VVALTGLWTDGTRQNSDPYTGGFLPVRRPHSPSGSRLAAAVRQIRGRHGGCRHHPQAQYPPELVFTSKARPWNAGDPRTAPVCAKRMLCPQIDRGLTWASIARCSRWWRRLRRGSTQASLGHEGRAATGAAGG